MKENNLPGYNCGQCGFKTCEQYAKAKTKKKCPFIIVDEIRNETADFRLGALGGEPSCKETLLPLGTTHLREGTIIRYRPLMCPIVHYGKVLERDGDLIIVHIVGPKYSDKFTDLGICIVLAFEGQVVEGRIPKPCETVKFFPDKCMMRKTHLGIVTHVEGKRIRIEGIDLKCQK